MVPLAGPTTNSARDVCGLLPRHTLSLISHPESPSSFTISTDVARAISAEYARTYTTAAKTTTKETRAASLELRTVIMR